MNRILALLILISCTLGAWSQNGQPFLTHIEADGIALDSRTFSMVQDENEVMLIAKRQGILAYDGINWDLIEVPGIPLKLTVLPNGGPILVGLSNSFGKLELNGKGEYSYVSLLDSSSFGPSFNEILIGKDQLFIYSSTAIYSIDPGLDSVPTLIKDIDNPAYDGAVVAGSRFFAKKVDGTLDVLYGDSLIALPTRPFEEDESLIFNIQVETGKVIIGTSNDRLVEFNGKRFMELAPDDQAYLREHIIIKGIALDNNRYAIGTISGGCVVIDGKSRETLFSLNYRTGMPDNEVMAMCTDQNGGLWIAHAAGITRVDLELPINEYSSYPGLEGNLLTSIYHNGKLYVGTNNGVFYLTRTKNMVEYNAMIKRQESQKNAVRNKVISQPKISHIPTGVKKKLEEKGVLEDGEINMDALSAKEKRQLKRKLRRAKKKRKKEADNKGGDNVNKVIKKQPNEEVVKPIARKNQVIPKNIEIPEIQAKQTRMEQASSYMFQKVKDLDIKSKQFITYKNRLLTATNNGVYEIVGTVAKPIVEDVYVNYISTSKKANRFYVCTSNGFSILEDLGGKWSQIASADSIEANIYSVVEDGASAMWIGSDNTAWHLTLNENGTVIDTKEYWFGTDFSESVQITNINGIAHFLLSSGVYRFDSSREKMIPVSDKEFYLQGNGEYIINGTNNDWFYNGTVWQPFGSGAQQDVGNARFLELFDDLQDIHRDADGNLWVVDGNSKLIRIDADAESSLSVVFNVYIRRMMDDEGMVFPLNELLVLREQNSLEFLISAPFYLKSDGTQYQYRVVGLKESWSRWSASSSIEIPFIPAGDYTLEIRARNIFGNESAINSLVFQIEETIWKRWYMILLYFLLLASAVFAIVKIREKSLRETQRELEAKVKDRTKELEKQKVKVEDLLLNILPKETAEELQKYGKATAKHYNMASVLFTDFKGFTRFAEKIKPQDLVTELDNCFVRFDEVITDLGIEKIKTIGDAYMCAGGVPKANKGNPISTTLGALRIRNTMRSIAEEKKALGEKFWEIRIGVHTGPLTAGVVGKKKFAYDIWGDTVNTASRMESSSEPGKVNISGVTHELIKEYFECEYRGKIDAKGKGLIDMYFVKGIKANYSENGDGITPNTELKKVMEW